MKFPKFNSLHIVVISYKFHDDWPHCYKIIRGKVWVIVYAYRQVCACKSKDVYRHKNQLDALIQSAYILVNLYTIHSWSIAVNRMEIKPVFLYAANAWTDIVT